MTRKRVYLITGASGFIGSCLARELVSKNEEVHLLLRKAAKPWRVDDILNQVTVYGCDLSDLKELRGLIEKIQPTVIYHLATYGAYSSQQDPDLCIKTNIQGTQNLLTASLDVDFELFVNTGSSSEYGFKKAPMKETDLLEPASHYAVTKSAQTLLCSHTAQSEKRPVVTLRLFSVYGPYEEPSRFIPTLMRALRSKGTMKLVSPETAHDHICVEDVLRAYLSVERLKEFPGEIFNIGSGLQSSVKEVVETAVRVTGETTTFEWGSMPPRIWDTNLWLADISKAKRLLGWSPATALPEGLFQTWEWFKTNRSLWPGG